MEVNRVPDPPNSTIPDDRPQTDATGEGGPVSGGRLVTKQGQMLANALLAGIASGIGQGLSTASTS